MAPAGSATTCDGPGWRAGGLPSGLPGTPRVIICTTSAGSPVATGTSTPPTCAGAPAPSCSAPPGRATVPEPLSGIARAIGQAIHRRPVDPDELRGLAVRLEAFAEAEPRLEPDSRTNLLTQLARAVDPTTP